jgi:hypothetical protein
LSDLLKEDDTTSPIAIIKSNGPEEVPTPEGEATPEESKKDPKSEASSSVMAVKYDIVSVRNCI